MQVFRRPDNLALGLPPICRQRGCYESVKHHGLLCETHAQLERVRLLTYSGPKKKASFQSRKEQSRYFPTHLYAVRAREYVKFGVAINVRDRLSGLQTGHPEKLRLYGWLPATRAVEAAVHRHLADDRATGEWFKWSEKPIAIAKLVRVKDFAGLLEVLGDKLLIERLDPGFPKPPEPMVCRLD